MTLEEKLQRMQNMLGDETEDVEVLTTYLQVANNKILNHKYPYGTNLVNVEPRYENDQIELAIVLYSKRGAEGQETHNENGVNRKWRTEQEILSSIPRRVGIPR